MSSDICPFFFFFGRETKYLKKSLTSLLSLGGMGHAGTGGNTALKRHHSNIPSIQLLLGFAIGLLGFFHD